MEMKQPPPVPGMKEKELDGFVLLKAAGVGFPEDSRRANISGRGFTAVVSDDLFYFTGLVYVDASENYLDFLDLESLPELIELRLSCNYIENIRPIQGYPQLQYLDLSYNSLTQESVMALSSLPMLRDLDLSGNELKMLPPNMCMFSSLERLVLEHNKLDDNSIFFELCQIPNLRELGLSYNMLAYVPSQACCEDYFRVLEVLDLTYNYIAAQSDIEPCLECPRLLQLLIYGNPILGTTGEDPTGVYVEELVDSAIAARDGYSLPVLEIVTEAPKKRTLRKGGFVADRHSMYKDFSIEHVDNERQTLKKTARQYKMEGNKTLFAQAVDVARKTVTPVQSREEFEDASSAGFFLTSVHSSDRRAAMNRKDQVADSVMQDVAEKMDLNNDSEMNQLRNKMSANDYKNDENEAQKVPHDLFTRSMTNPSSLQTYPVSLNTAIKSLRFALEFPITNDAEVPPSSLFPPKHYHQKTELSKLRQLPRLEGGKPVEVPSVEEKVRLSRLKQQQKQQQQQADHQKPHAKDKDGKRLASSRPPALPSTAKRSSDRGGRSPGRKAGGGHLFAESMREKRKTHQDRESMSSTMKKIEDVLDGLNKNTMEFSQNCNAGGQQDHHLFAGMGRPNTGVKGLIRMVNEVVDELEK